MASTSLKFENSSYKDPAGFVFSQANFIYRQVNRIYQDDYLFLKDSGLYDELCGRGLLIRHTEADVQSPLPDICYKIIQPEKISFISYPYEWCFSQLKDAALLTLEIQKHALTYGMILKDATPFNIQFFKGAPILIDTLSFTRYQNNAPWDAYRQFCRQFLAPLALTSFVDGSCIALLKIFPDGIPLSTTHRMLPFSSRFNFGILNHIHLHASSEKIFESSKSFIQKNKSSLYSLQALTDNLYSTISNLRWNAKKTPWLDYTSDVSYSEKATTSKLAFVQATIDRILPDNVWDLGANDGFYSLLSTRKGIFTLAIDGDCGSVEKCYLDNKKDKNIYLHPLFMDIRSPSAASGWNLAEFLSLKQRGPAGLVLALALVHHLAISGNLPFTKIAEFFVEISTWLLIEFIPRDDPQFKRMISSRKDIFSSYSRENFEKAFGEFFELIETSDIDDSLRSLYLFRRKE